MFPCLCHTLTSTSRIVYALLLSGLEQTGADYDVDEIGADWCNRMEQGRWDVPAKSDGIQ